MVGTLQLTFIPGLSYRGAERTLVEAVRVESSLRGQGIGKAMMQWVVEESRRRGCRLVQLTSHEDRKEAHRFYESLGFRGTHLGMKLLLE